MNIGNINHIVWGSRAGYGIDTSDYLKPMMFKKLKIYNQFYWLLLAINLANYYRL
jgi:hypothetical protein